MSGEMLSFDDRVLGKEVLEIKDFNSIKYVCADLCVLQLHTLVLRCTVFIVYHLWL